MANKKCKKAAPKDFEKKQVRVGRLKPGAANATNTSFTAKAIQLKDQAIPDEVDILARRKDVLARLTVSLSQLSHYSASFRRQAVSSLFKNIKEMDDIQMHAIHISECFSKTVVDDDKDVRQVSYSIWMWIVKDARLELAIGTILNILIPFIKMGLTHLNKEIGFDSAKLYQLVLNECSTAVRPFIADILPHLSKLLSSKSFEEPKKGALDFIELYCKSINVLLEHAPEENTILEYNWMPIQSKSLRLPPRKMRFQVSSISTEQVNTHLPVVMKLVIPVWSQTGYLLTTPSFAVSDKDEIYLFKRSLYLITSCYRLCVHVGLNIESFVPSKLVQSNSWAALTNHLINA